MNSEERSNEREAIRQRSQRLHATGTGNALAVADDVRSLLDSLAAVERERDAYKRSATAAWEAHEGVSEMYTEAESELATALARIAAVEALCERWEAATELGTGSPSIVLRAMAHEVRAALAASPTPTTEEQR